MLIRYNFSVIIDDEISDKPTPDSIIAVKGKDGWQVAERGVIGSLVSQEIQDTYEALTFQMTMQVIAGMLNQPESLNCVDLIILQGAAKELNQDGNGYLHLYAINSFNDKNLEIENAKCMQKLISHGADPVAKNNLGETPYAYAVKRGNFEVMRVLILNGADRNQLINGQPAHDKLPSYLQDRYPDFERGIIAEMNEADLSGKATGVHKRVSF